MGSDFVFLAVFVYNRFYHSASSFCNIPSTLKFSAISSKCCVSHVHPTNVLRMRCIMARICREKGRGNLDTMAESDGEGKKPACKYGFRCYRKNQEHLRRFAHPATGDVEESDDSGSGSQQQGITGATSPPPTATTRRSKRRVSQGLLPLNLPCSRSCCNLHQNSEPLPLFCVNAGSGTRELC